MIRNVRSWLIFALLISFAIPIDADAQWFKKKEKDKEVEISIYDIDTLQSPVPRNRQIFHDKIDREQRGADAFDGKRDDMVYYGDDTLFTRLLTESMLTDIDQMQIMIENLPPKNQDPVMDHQEKIRYLRALWDLVSAFNSDVQVDPYTYRKRVKSMREMIIASYEDNLSDYIRNNVNIHTLNNTKELVSENSTDRAYIYREMGKKEPEMMIRRLSEFAKEDFAEDVIAAAARVVPNEVYNFASSSNYVLSGAVRRTQDPLVQAIVRITQESNSPLRAMPFLSDIYNKRKTIAEIDQITADPDLFYQNLVRLKLENEQLADNTYTGELKYRGLKYVREMNDLHNERDPVRFKSIENFPPETLYFIMVYGQDEIYTSSFLGTFKRMVERMKPMTGDELLAKVHYDRFRTFIRMCAGYNTLSDFLATLEPENRNKLMSDFIAGLDKGKENDLEDAVDVADAFGSLRDSALITFLKKEVKSNYERSYKERSKKGVIVYGLLATLFENASAAADNEQAAVRQSEKLNLPPVNLVPYKYLAGDSGIVYEQFFFYGDDDGKASYNSFLGNFRDGKWKVVKNNYWTTISSTSGKPIVIYANLPLAEPEDEEAQKKLCEYLAQNNIKPTIMVHRGHSYHLPLTMERLNKSSRIVMLGSCGGYHNLATVLDKSPDAQIISSKQTGAMSINEPIIKALNDQLLAGKDINWITTWRSLNTHFDGKGTVKEMFDDYVPPHKNLGVIFIKAYRRMFNAEEAM